ncbi:MAG: hypothetical protein R3F51_27375 [Cyanobacteriota/Melainabacteria group bacterium]
MLRSKGKHCIACGVPLAMATPTQMPAFTQTRPPLEVSVKEDHLLVERVVNQRQLTMLGSGRKSRTAYSTSSGSYVAPVTGGYGSYGTVSSEARPAGNGNGNGNGNGHGNGSGNGGGNGNGGSHDFGVSVANGASPTPAPAPAPAPAEPVEEKPSPSLNAFGMVSIEDKPTTEAAASTPSSLMSSLSQKGLLGQNKAVEPEKEAIRSEDWGGIPPEAKDSRTEESGQENSKEPEAPASSNTRSQYLARGIGGSAVSIAIGSAVNSSFSSASPVPQKTTGDNIPSVPESGAASPSDEAPPSQSAIETAEALDSVVSMKAKSLEETSEAVSEASEAPKSFAESIMSSGAFPTQVVRSDNVVITENVSMAASLPAPVSEEAPDSSPDLDPESDPAGATSDTNLSVSATGVRIGGSVPNDKLNTPEFDFAEQFGTDFNPEAFFSGVEEEEPRVGAEFENLPIVQSEPEPQSVEVAAEVTSNDSRKDVIDFFGDPGASAGTAAIAGAAAGAIAGAAAGAAISAARSGGTSGADEVGPGGGFDFFDESSSVMSKRPYVQDSDGEAEEDDSRTTVLPYEDTSADLDSGARPMVAMPRGVKTRAVDEVKQVEPPPAPSVKDEKHETSNDEEDEEKEAASGRSPKRRSFSGGSIAPQETKRSRKKEELEDADEDEDDEDDEDGDGKLSWLEQEVNLGGLHVSRQTAIVLVSVGAFILIQIPGWVMAFAGALTGGGGQPQVASQPGMGPGMGGGQPQQQQQPQTALMRARSFPTPGGGMPQPGSGAPQQGGDPSQSGQASPLLQMAGGQWRVNVYAGQKQYPANMILQQTGPNLRGSGQDGFGNFEIVGAVYEPNKIEFNKSYDNEAKRKGALSSVITFTGQLGQQEGHVIAQGAYRSTKRVGYEQSINNPARMVTIGDKWTAVQVAAQPAGQPQQASGIQIPNPFAGLGGPQKPAQSAGMPHIGHKDPRQVQQFFLQIALGLIGVGVLIFMFFLMLFGPSGWMNIWEKKKYIPSQFKNQHMKMVRELGKTLKPGSVPLGRRMEWGWWCFWTPRSLAMPPDMREKNPHMLLLGGSDKGKTRLMAKMITHDIKSEDRAIVVIDSDGCLADLVINWIASQPDGKKYAKRVVLVDPTYSAGSLAYNPLEMPEDGDLQAAASAIVHGFKAIYSEPPGQQGGGQNQWNQQTANILRNATLLLMANGRTLTDLPNLLQDNDFRDIMLETVERKKDEKTEYINIIDTWNQYKKLARTDQWINWVEPILNRVGPMLGDGRIRPILTKPVSDLKLKEIILGKKILIVKVPQGELDQNANLLGSLMVTGLQQAAMSLGRERPHDIRPAALYLDDMDSFIEKETVEQLTAETRRYQIGFVGSIKTLQHLPEDFKSQLIINVGTMCVFALAKKDGDLLGPQMFRVDGRKIKHQTITNFFNKVNTSPQFELIMDEEKLNIDRIVGQEEQTYFCYQVGTVAGVFKLKAHDFKDVPRDKLDRKLIEKMHAITDNFSSSKQ